MALHFTGQVTNTFDLIEPNFYETRVSLEYKKTNEGNLYINCRFAIRDDVEQEFQRRIVFDGIYKNRTTGEFSEQKINGLLAAVNATEAHPKWDFEDYDDLLQFLNNKPVKVEIVVQKADANYPGSVDKNVVKYLSYKPTEYKEVSYSQPITQNNEPVFGRATEQGYVFEVKQENNNPVNAIQKDDILDDLPF